MNHETLYTATKWDLLKLLEHDEKTIQELAQETNTSQQNISQQLKLLELAGIITKTQTRREAAKYTIGQNSCYVISTSNSFVEKKHIPLETRRQIILRIWFLEDKELREYAERAFWKIEEELPNIQALYIDHTSNQPIHFYVLAKQALNTPQIQEIRNKEDTRTLITYNIQDEKELIPLQQHLTQLYKQ